MRDLVRDQTEGTADGIPLEEDVDAEAADPDSEWEMSICRSISRRFCCSVERIW